MVSFVRRVAAPVLLLAVLLGAAACSAAQDRAEPARVDVTPPAPATATATATPATAAAPAPAAVADPTTIRVPAIGVNASVVGVGLNPDGSMEVPDFGLAAWYTEGPKPGAAGPAVVVGHVDSRTGPDVFYRLTDLQDGDEIAVDRADGTSGTWRVVGMEQVDKDELPVDRIWNPTDQALLRLITCGGIFDRSIRHYRDNVIVYAEPAV